MSKNGLPYSYHTFLFPFIWKTQPDIEKEKFLDAISIGKVWIERKCDDAISSERLKDIPHPTNEQLQKNEIDKRFLEWFQDYQANQYFTDAANRVIFNENGENIVRCYQHIMSYGIEDDKDKGSYIIKKEEKEYVLTINNIRLNIYEAGIAILILEMENHHYRTLDDVNAINEYGRRINLPFFTYPFIGEEEEAIDENRKVSHSLCADSITVKIPDWINLGDNYPDGRVLVEDYHNTLMNVFDFMKTDKQLSFSYIMSPIQDILDGGHDKITANKNHKKAEEEKDKFYIKPCVDDRMFVCCMVMDQALSQELQGIGKSGISYLSDCDKKIYKDEFGDFLDVTGKKYKYYEEGWSDEQTLSSRIYKLLFIENDLTCQETTMKRKLLCSSVYRRWLDMGTIYGVTHHSLICINSGNEAIINSVINPFLIEYVQMAILTLAQRSVLLMLEDEVALVSNKLAIEYNENVGLNKFEDNLKEIERLQATYVKVQNQLLLSEITVQEQGVELYEMLRQQLYLEKNMADLDVGMHNLRDVADIANARFERQHDKEETEMRERQFAEQERLRKEQEEFERREEEKRIQDDKIAEEKRQKDEKAAEQRFNRLALLFGVCSICEPFAMMFYDIEIRCGHILWFVSTLVFFAGVYIYFYKDKFKKKDSDHNSDAS